MPALSYFQRVRVTEHVQWDFFINSNLTRVEVSISPTVNSKLYNKLANMKNWHIQYLPVFHLNENFNIRK